MVAIQDRGAVRGVRLVAHDSVMDYIRRAMGEVSRGSRRARPRAPIVIGELPLFSAAPDADA